MERRTPDASFRFPRSARITRGAELQRIAREGKRIRTTNIEVRIDVSPFVQAELQNIPLCLRVGIIVPRYKQTAVARNRLKRRLRELIRLRILPMELPLNVVFRARMEAYDASYRVLATDIASAEDQLEHWFRNRVSPGKDL